MPELIDLQATRRNLLDQAHAISEKAKGEKRELTAEEQTNYRKAFDDAQELKTKIDQQLREREVNRERATLEALVTRPAGGDGANAHDLLERSEFRSLVLADLYHDERDSFGRLKRHGVNGESRRRIALVETRTASAYRAWVKAFSLGERELTNDERRALAEHRDLMMGSDPAGGFTVPPEQFLAALIRKIDDRVYIRRLATKLVVTKAQDLGVPTLEDNPADADWTSELATGSDDTAMDFGKRAFAPHPLAKLIKVSKKLLRASAINIADLIADRFAYKFGISEEKAFLLGNGAQQPLGVFTASAAGISTDRDVNTGNTTSAIVADNLRAVKYTLKAPYRANAQWILHRDVVSQVSQLKDGIGNYLWRDGLQMGDPDMLLGMPVNESEYAPNTFTTGQYLGILGDFSRYWIADSLDMTVQRLVELYAASNQEGFIMRQELDGMPVLEEAFVRITLA